MSAPLLPAPPDGDVDLRGRFMAGIIIMTIIAVAVAWLRMYTRAFVSRNLWWDDWTMFVASFITIVTNAFLINAYHLGLGRHLFYVPPSNVPETFKWLWAAEPTNLFAVFLVRLSIALFFLRLVPPKKRYIRTIWGIIAILAISDIYVSINFFFECVPIHKVWLPSASGSCAVRDAINQSALWLFQAASILSDVVLLCIPVCMFWRLQVDLRTKLVLIFLCCLGVFTCACAIVKSVLLPNLTSTDPDKTWIVANLCLWAPLELCVGMICGSIPTLRPLFLYWQNRTSKNSYIPSGAPMKLESFGRPTGDRAKQRAHKVNQAPSSQFSIIKSKPSLLPSVSEERIVPPEEENRILKTQDIEISFKNATMAGKSTDTQHAGWNAV
ncbi:hypothetical protein XANCAGTX0491_006818 [Xanthoria calcicola]